MKKYHQPRARGYLSGHFGKLWCTSKGGERLKLQPALAITKRARQHHSSTCHRSRPNFDVVFGSVDDLSTVYLQIDPNPFVGVEKYQGWFPFTSCDLKTNGGSSHRLRSFSSNSRNRVPSCPLCSFASWLANWPGQNNLHNAVLTNTEKVPRPISRQLKTTIF